MKIIEAQGLSLTYGAGTPLEIHALSDCSFSLESGELLCVIGHTGSGKSTLMQLLNGLLTPTSGTVLFGGRDIFADKKRLREVRFEVGLVFQYPEHQLFEETVYKDIAFGPKNKGLRGDELDAAIREAAQFAGLDEALLEKSPFDLSGGEKRRAAIAGVMAMRPRVLILDEPTAGLDPKGREQMIDRIMQYRDRTGASVILVSHTMEDVARCADRVLVLNHGEVLQCAPPSQVFRDAEMLESVGLQVPQITKVFIELNKLGFDVDTSVYTVEQGLAEAKRLLEGGGCNAQ
ncbi:MAG: energy-coupling factor transporter ATPase [Clostridia bacterium]|nr:energy-coupling factor transporter ATPase [Clostridia bacterium]